MKKNRAVVGMAFVMLAGTFFVNQIALAVQEEQSNVAEVMEIPPSDSEGIVFSNSSEENTSNTDEKLMLPQKWKHLILCFLV